jgi:hypothetical protein
MRIEFHVTGAGRRALVTAIGEILEVRPKYLGMPTAAYEVDYFRIDKNGTVEFDDRADSGEIENLLEQLAERGFAGEGQEAATDATKETAENDTAGADTAPQDENVRLTVAMPLGSANIDNIKKMLEAKGSLIKKAFGIDELPVEVDGEKISFPWFSEMDSDTARACTNFISALCKMSREQKRITATEKAVDNEKYAFRCFLLRLGFIGDEYKSDRKILLRNLKGSSAFKSGTKKEADADEISEQ